MAIILLFLLVLAHPLLLPGCGGEAEEPVAEYSAPAATVPVEKPPFEQKTYENKPTIHFVASEPANNALLTERPSQVTINFSCDLGSGSFVSVKKDGIEMTEGPMIQSRDNRSITAKLRPSMTTGNYHVQYAAYWCDGSYCEGSFGFSVDLPPE